jgi:hypothetical protein
MSVLCTGLTYFAIATLATEAHAGPQAGCPSAAVTQGRVAHTAPAAPAAGAADRERERARAEASAAAEAKASALKPADDPEREHWRHHGVG